MNLDTVAGNARVDSTGFVGGMEMLMHQEVLVRPFGRRQMNILGVPFSDTRTGWEQSRRRRSGPIAATSDESSSQVFFGRIAAYVMSARLYTAADADEKEQCRFRGVWH